MVEINLWEAMARLSSERFAMMHDEVISHCTLFPLRQPQMGSM
jgi:hypothetical protein